MPRLIHSWSMGLSPYGANPPNGFARHPLLARPERQAGRCRALSLPQGRPRPAAEPPAQPNRRAVTEAVGGSPPRDSATRRRQGLSPLIRLQASTCVVDVLRRTLTARSRSRQRRGRSAGAPKSAGRCPAEARHKPQACGQENRRALPFNRAISCDAPPSPVCFIAELNGALATKPDAGTGGAGAEPQGRPRPRRGGRHRSGYECERRDAGAFRLVQLAARPSG
jgi:hypothetical protein